MYIALIYDKRNVEGLSNTKELILTELERCQSRALAL